MLRQDRTKHAREAVAQAASLRADTVAARLSRMAECTEAESLGSQTRDGRDVPAAQPRDGRAMARTSITIVLELDETTDSPSGRARLADGTARDFHGWLGLAEAIDALARTPASLGPADTTDGKETP